jgi:hypothetical protein
MTLPGCDNECHLDLPAFPIHSHFEERIDDSSVPVSRCHNQRESVAAAFIPRWIGARRQ